MHTSSLFHYSHCCQYADSRGCPRCTSLVCFPITLCVVYYRHALPYFTSAGETAALKGCSAGKPQCFSFDIPASLSCKPIQLCKSTMPEWSHHQRWTRSNALRMNHSDHDTPLTRLKGPGLARKKPAFSFLLTSVWNEGCSRAPSLQKSCTKSIYCVPEPPTSWKQSIPLSSRPVPHIYRP